MEIPLSLVGLIVSLLSIAVSIVTLFKAVIPVYNKMTILLSDIIGEPNRPGLFERVSEIEATVDKIDRENELFNSTITLKLEELSNAIHSKNYDTYR